MGSVRTTFAELEELFTTEELETFFEELDPFFEELEELFNFTELDELFVFFELDELLDFAELEDSSTSAELDDGASFLLEEETLALLEELLISSAELEELTAFLLLELDLTFFSDELDSTDLSELELYSGSTRFTLEESSPQAAKKNKGKTGSKLRIFISKIYHV